MDETPQFDSAVTCSICSAGIPAVKMDLRMVARYVCSNCGNDVLIEDHKPQTDPISKSSPVENARRGKTKAARRLLPMTPTS